MLYTAILTKKKKLFQKAYTIEDDMIYITDTKRAKKKFLKSGLRNVVFKADVTGDEIFGEMVKPLYEYNETFLLGFLEEMLLQLAGFLKINLPLETLVISDKRAFDIAIKYAKTVIVAEEGVDCTLDGVNIIYSKRLKRMPDAAIILNNSTLPPLPGVPTVDLREAAVSGKNTVTWQTLCFECDKLHYEINARSLIYLLKQEGNFGFELTNMRKKLPPLFTFY